MPRPADVAALVEVYGGVSGVEAEMLERLVTESRTRGWWEPFTEGLRSDPHFLPSPVATRPPRPTRPPSPRST